ncbi:MAG: TRAP transporter large permease [Deferrisomatales bacterium]
MTSVVSSALFGAISGSGISTVVTVGGVMFPFMKEQGYPRSFSVGLVTSASILGMIIPPSIIMVICALTAGVSVVRLFAAGYLPGAVITLALMTYVYVSVRRQGLAERTTEPFDLRLLGRAVRQATMPLLIIVVLFAGVYSGAFTVTEASVVACFLAVVTEWLIYRSIDFRTLRGLFVSSGILSGTLVITIAGAGVLSEYITIRGIPQEILEVATAHVPNWVAFMLLVTTVLLVMGTFMDPIASIMILVPILMPIVHQFGIDPIHFCLIVNVAPGGGVHHAPPGADALRHGGLHRRDVHVHRAGDDPDAARVHGGALLPQPGPVDLHGHPGSPLPRLTPWNRAFRPRPAGPSSPRPG